MSKSKLFFKNLCIPIIIHIVLVAIGNTVDPCNGNPGCMAGSATAYFVILVSIPVIIIILITFIIQAFQECKNHNKYFKINMSISILPVVLVGILIAIN